MPFRHRCNSIVLRLAQSPQRIRITSEEERAVERSPFIFSLISAALAAPNRAWRR